MSRVHVLLSSVKGNIVFLLHDTVLRGDRPIFFLHELVIVNARNCLKKTIHVMGLDLTKIPNDIFLGNVVVIQNLHVIAKFRKKINILLFDPKLVYYYKMILRSTNTLINPKF